MRQPPSFCDVEDSLKDNRFNTLRMAVMHFMYGYIAAAKASGRQASMKEAAESALEVLKISPDEVNVESYSLKKQTSRK